MIQVKDLSFSYAGQPLYEHASFVVPKNKKAGLVGLNGSGKSTLFQLILGEEYPDEGNVRTEGNVILVPQEVSSDKIMDKQTTVRDYLHHAKKFNDDRLKELLFKMDLADVKLDDHPKQLSGGQKTKLAILHAVLAEPDVLLLDEPTNFMDDAGKKWVMHWLSQYQQTLLVVSHDLHLLDQSITKVIYINKQTKQIEEYTGNYSKFKKLKSDRDEQLTRYIKNEEQKIARMKKSVEILRKSTLDKVVKRRVQLERRIEKMEINLPKVPKEIVNIKLELPEPAPMGELPIWITHLSKSYGNHHVIKDLSFSVRKNQRIALIGKNGSGKSTLIKSILGLTDIDGGEVKLHEQAKIGYYSQEFESYDLNQSIYELVKSKEVIPEVKIRSFLAKFMFTQNTIWQQANSLSGGEKTRLAIAMLMLEHNNLLILDEPTTYLDVLSQRIILEALKQYQGTMLIVSHTPEFLMELKPDHALLMPQEKYVFWSNDLLPHIAKI
jgi:ATPase subunit of ABC transporter with duplicated ATPase domains